MGGRGALGKGALSLMMARAGLSGQRQPSSASGGSTNYERRDARGLGNSPCERGERREKLQRWVKVYAPRRTKTGGYTTQIRGKQGKSGKIHTSETETAPEKGEMASVPYYEVYSDYRKAAEQAVAREDVPPAYRKRVKDYFKSLE